MLCTMTHVNKRSNIESSYFSQKNLIQNINTIQQPQKQNKMTFIAFGFT